MNIDEKVISEQEIHTNELLAMIVRPDSDLKNMLVEYVGTQLEQEDVTVNMIAETIASEFPEFAFAYAEENFLRGYQLGLDDAHKTFTRETEEKTTQDV
tara:strand:- start:1069 stop:1365 length:297 start_codon:yes stop_codon:yes gene_type:complete